MKTQRLTTAQALITFLQNQFVERDGKEGQFFAGVWGIFGHGNVAGVGQALQQRPGFRYYLARNEQAMVHTATAFAKMSNRLRTFACTSSIGPGATNMITGAATAKRAKHWRAWSNRRASRSERRWPARARYHGSIRKISKPSGRPERPALT